MGFWPKRAC